MKIRGAIKIKTIIVIIILLLVGVLGVVGMGAVRTYMSGASASEGPKGVVASTSADGKIVNISFTTDKEVQAVVKYGLSPTNMMMTKTESAQATEHNFELTSLKANSSYYYSIDIGGNTFDNGGIPWSFSTKVTEETQSVVPTIEPTVVPLPTASVSSCDYTTDYNQDGIVNSLDYFDCQKSGGTSLSPTKSVDKCIGVDFNKDGIANAVDVLECRQSEDK